MYDDDYRQALRRLRDLLYDRRQAPRRLLADDPAIKAFTDSEDGQRALRADGLPPIAGRRARW